MVLWYTHTQVEANKDRKERREPPAPPPELDQPLPSAPDDIDAFNQRMSDIYNGVSLMKCTHCGRTMRSGVTFVKQACIILPTFSILQLLLLRRRCTRCVPAGQMRCHVTKSCARPRSP